MITHGASSSKSFKSELDPCKCQFDSPYGFSGEHKKENIKRGQTPLTVSFTQAIPDTYSLSEFWERARVRVKKAC
jgi:hypothetical protein